MTKTTPRAKYTLEFKLEAVRLVEAGQSIAAAARTLGWPRPPVGGVGCCDAGAPELVLADPPREPIPQAASAPAAATPIAPASRLRRVMITGSDWRLFIPPRVLFVATAAVVASHAAGWGAVGQVAKPGRQSGVGPDRAAVPCEQFAAGTLGEVRLDQPPASSGLRRASWGSRANTA